MKSVIYINEQPKEKSRPIKITHFHTENGWSEDDDVNLSDFDKVIYLGNDFEHGDLFVCYLGDGIYIYKGLLNSGKY